MSSRHPTIFFEREKENSTPTKVQALDYGSLSTICIIYHNLGHECDDNNDNNNYTI